MSYSTLEAPPEGGRCFGPVDSLENHVSDDWWRTLFGPSYLLTDADVTTPSITRTETDRLVDLLGLSPEDRILDLCCGPGRHSLELSRRGFEHVEGLDRSAFLIEEARAIADGEDLDATFQVGDSRQLPYAENTFDAVLLMGNSFGYFSEAEDDRRVLSEVQRVLRPGGRVLLDLANGAYLKEHFEPRSWEWIDDEHFVCRERELSDDGRRLISREVITHVRRGVLRDQFYAERLYDASEIRRLLLSASFSSVEHAGSLTTASLRGQDLGMMARRFWTVARAVENSSTASAGGKLEVVVLLGDPRLPDEMKLGGCFDEDDFEVIDRMKATLASLDGYSFSYFDRHESLLSDLQQHRGKFDLALNLCDEGLHNDPRRELHIPALLEMLDLPYTGAGPQSLAHCYDKSLVRGVAREMGVPVARALFLSPGTKPPTEISFGFPIIVKPNQGDCSLGITQHSVAHGPEELARAVNDVRRRIGADVALLLEEFLPGKDLTLGVLGNPAEGLEPLPITEDDYSALPEDLPPVCGFEAKWEPDSPYWGGVRAVEAELAPSVREAIEQHSQRLFVRLGCRDYARFDWRLDGDGEPHLLEVNPNPGWCWDGHLAAQAAFAGYDYAKLLRRILEAAVRRFGLTTKALTR